MTYTDGVLIISARDLLLHSVVTGVVHEPRDEGSGTAEVFDVETTTVDLTRMGREALGQIGVDVRSCSGRLSRLLDGRAVDCVDGCRGGGSGGAGEVSDAVAACAGGGFAGAGGASVAACGGRMAAVGTAGPVRSAGGHDMIWYHYTCDHGRAGIGKLLVTTALVNADARARMPQWLQASADLIWLTDLAEPLRDALGLTSRILDCDRTRHRYRVVDHQPTRYTAIRRDLPQRTRDELEACPGAMPMHWWVAYTPVLVVLDPGPDRRPP